jgi:hypothetical protein
VGVCTRLFPSYNHPEHQVSMGVSVNIVREMFESIRASAIARCASDASSV